MAKQTVKTTRPDARSYAAAITNVPKFVKQSAGVNPQRDDGALEFDVPYECTVTKAEIINRSGKGHATPQLALTLTTEDGVSTMAGIDLPLEEGAGLALGMSEEEEFTYSARAADRFQRFLRAVSYTEFSAYGELDKSGGSKWVYFDHEGNEMSNEARTEASNLIGRMVLGLSVAFQAGDFSYVTGAQVQVTRRANAMSPNFPYTNFASKGYASK